MKKVILSIFLIILSVNIFAEFNESPIVNRHYRVFYQTKQVEAEIISEKIDSFFDLYNSYFRFDTKNLPLLNVKLLDNKNEYLDYTSTLVKDPVSSFLYIQYKDILRCELVGYLDADDKFNETLIHYTFIQFLRTFINNPPQWLEKGFAIYFEKYEYNSEKKEIFSKDNLVWLNTLKDYIDSDDKQLIALNKFFKMDKENIKDDIDIFYAQSWGIISFLLNSQNAIYNRVIWDAINKMSKESAKKDNESAVVKSFSWLDSDKFSKDFYNYINSLKTFPQLLENGISLYEEKKYTDAKISFIKAIAIDDKNYVPYYYLGLISYNEEDYDMAKFYYNSALQMNGDTAICYYALGINSFAQQDYANAVKYLKTALKYDSSYKAKVDKILEIITNTLKLQNKKLNFNDIQPITVSSPKKSNIAPEKEKKSSIPEDAVKIDETVIEKKVEKKAEEKPSSEVKQEKAVEVIKDDTETVAPQTNSTIDEDLYNEHINEIESNKHSELKLNKITGEYYTP